MKFLADMGISIKTVSYLKKLKYDALHLHEQGLDELEDSIIIEKALDEKRIILTNDLDFCELVAASKTTLPSVIIFRLRNMHPDYVNYYLNEIIDKHRAILEHGAIISVNEGQIRVRILPT